MANQPPFKPFCNECAYLNAQLPAPSSCCIPPSMNKNPLSLVELLSLNINQTITIYLENSMVKGILEYVGEGYVVLLDLKQCCRSIYFITHINRITFDDDIIYCK